MHKIHTKERKLIPPKDPNLPSTEFKTLKCGMQDEDFKHFLVRMIKDVQKKYLFKRRNSIQKLKSQQHRGEKSIKINEKISNMEEKLCKKIKNL